MQMLLVSRAWSRGGWLQNPRGPRGQCWLTGGWDAEDWVKPGPKISAGQLAGRAGSWSLAAGPGDPRAGGRSPGGIGGSGGL